MANEKNKIKSRASYIIRGGRETLRDVFVCFIIIDADVTRKIYIAPKEEMGERLFPFLFVCLSSVHDMSTFEFDPVSPSTYV